MKTIKIIAVLITFFLAGYLAAQYDTNCNVIQSTKSGDFIIRNGILYQVIATSRDTFYNDFKYEVQQQKKGL